MPMYFTNVTEDAKDYSSVSVDGKTFYYKNGTCAMDKKPKRRYSEQFNDPHFKAIDNYRRLNFFTRFFAENDLSKLTEKYKSAIAECIEILQKEGNIEPKAIFKHFSLKEYGFDPEEYGVDDKEDNEIES